MNFKKLLCLLIAALMLIGLTACGKAADTDTDDTDIEDTGNSETENDDTDAPDDTGADKDESTEQETKYTDEFFAGFSFSEGLDENGHFKGITAKDIVTLPEYKGITIPDDVMTADPDTVQEQIDSICRENAYYEQLTDRAAEDGDSINIDYVGYIDGVAFDGGNTNDMGTDVTIGVTSYIDDFLQQIIGHMPGETFDVNVTFPDNYGNEDLAGKDALFVTRLNYVYGEQVIPEFDDEIAAVYGYDTAAAFREFIENDIAESQKINFIYTIIDSAACDEIPEEVIEYAKCCEGSSLYFTAASYNITISDVIGIYGYETIDDYFADNEQEYKDTAKALLTIQAVAETENIEVSVDDIAESGMESYIAYYGEPYIKLSLLINELVPDFIIENRAK